MGQIEVNKSIRTKTVKFDDSSVKSLVRWAERGFFYLVAVMFIFFSTKDFLGGLTAGNLPISRIIIDLLIVLYGIWLIYSLAHLNKLSLIRGRGKETNKNLIHDLLTEMFADTKFIFIDDLLIGNRPWTSRKPGKSIVVIFSDSDILINITHKVRFGDMDSPFHVLINQADIREIKKRVER